MEKNPGTPQMKAWKELKQQGYPGGVKLTTKELRDYFATQVSAQVTDPNTVKQLMRHTSLTTTSRYVRTVTERMKQAVQNLGAILEANLEANLEAIPRAKIPKSDVDRTSSKRLIVRSKKRKRGGRSRTRTYDLAHVRRAL